jgi:hypothetical protein
MALATLADAAGWGDSNAMLEAQTDTMLEPYAGTRPGERVPPSRMKWRSWRLHVDADGTDDNMSAIRSGLLSENGSAPAPPLALVYFHKLASAAPTRMVDSLVVLYAGQGRRVSTVSRTWAGVKAKLQLGGRTGGGQTRKPEPMSIQGLAHFLASQPEQDWSCTCLADDVGDDKARFQQYLELVSGTPCPCLIRLSIKRVPTQPCGVPTQPCASLSTIYSYLGRRPPPSRRGAAASRWRTSLLVFSVTLAAVTHSRHSLSLRTPWVSLAAR